MEDEVRPLLGPSANRPPPLLPWDPRRARKSGIFILLSVTLERLAYYAVIMNLFLYLNKGQSEIHSWDPLQALTAVYVANGVSTIFAPLGGWLSDAWIGRYWAVITGMVIYICGYTLLTALSVNGLSFMGCNLCPNQSGIWIYQYSEEIPHSCSPHIYAIFVLIGIGVGCLRANVAPFGAEQVRVGGDNAIRQFFNCYYWCINAGSLIGVGILAYVEQDAQNGFFISYLTATASLCASLIMFCAGRYYYVIHRPGHSVLSNIFRILGEGLQNSWRRHRSVQGSPMFRHSSQQTLVALTPSWIDRAKISFGGSFHDATVDDVKHLARIMCFIMALLPYWLVYFQMSTSFQAQGLHMNVNMTDSWDQHFVIPTAWLTLFDQIFIIFLIPVLNILIYPFLDRHNVKLSPLGRIVIGMVLSSLAVVTAAVVEHFRLKEWQQGNFIIQIISKTSYNASSLSILWQIPQYCLVGAAEVFTGVAGLEYAYTSSPRSFQGIVMGLYSAVEGIGSFLGILLVQLTRILHLGWIRKEAFFNEGHLDYFFYVLAVIQVITVVTLGLVMYLRWNPPRLPPDPRFEETVGASALHSEFYRDENLNESAPTVHHSI